MPRPITQRVWLLAGLSSLLYILSFPKFNISYLAWVALLPLSMAVLHHPSLRRWEAFRIGWVSGIVTYLGLLYWIIPTYHAAEKPLALALLSLLLLAAYLGLYWGVWAEVLRRLRHTKPWQIALAGASTWVALEYLRAWLFSGFPWALLADTQVAFLSLIQIASITGVFGVSFLIVLLNVSLAARSRYLAPILLVLVAAWGHSQLAKPAASASTSKVLRVALLQGSIDQYKKWDQAYIEEIQGRYESLVQQASRENVDLMIWPETSVPGYLTGEAELYRWLLKVIRNSKTNHLIGTPNRSENKIYNTSFYIDRHGSFLAQYDKQHLVPFGEKIPMEKFLNRFISALNELGGFAAGIRTSVVKVGPISLGLSICYEAIFPAHTRQSVLEGAEVLVNQTNDGWYLKTSAPYQHWAPTIYRAVENRRYLLRANNTGISGIIDPLGRVVQASPIFEPAIVQGSVHSRSDLTFYTRHGDLFAQLCLLFCIVFLIRVILRPE